MFPKLLAAPMGDALLLILSSQPFLCMPRILGSVVRKDGKRAIAEVEADKKGDSGGGVACLGIMERMINVEEKNSPKKDGGWLRAVLYRGEGRSEGERGRSK